MTDQMPDLDSMSPEELMAWMESLAKRQGASEGFTTAADMEIAEIDPSQAQVDEPGYIPYGMDTEKWEMKKAEEDRVKAERRAQMDAEKARATPPPVQQTPPPAQPEPAAAAASTNPEDMTPEQLMAWMESLAKRQGASEGFTTSADMEIAEVDPSLAQVDEPGYIPYGMDAETWARKQEEEAQRKAARSAAASQPPVPVSRPEPEPEPEPELVSELDFGFDDFDMEHDETVRGEAAPENQDALSWLESIAAGGAEDAPSLDLDFSDLDALAQPASAATDDPLAWLESLSTDTNALAGLEQFSIDNLTDDAPKAPAAAAPISEPEPQDTLEWLESLAKRQGASEDELMTSASMDVPVPEQLSFDAPGYTDFSVDNLNEPLQNEFDFLNLGDSDQVEAELDVDALDETDNDWLSALAAGQIEPNTPPFVNEIARQQAEAEQEEILDRLQQGEEVPPEEMAGWMSNLLEEGAKRNVPDYLDEEDTDSLEQADLPDWLLQQVGTPPPSEAAAAPAAAPLSDDIVEPPVPEMPEWLRDSFEEEAEELNFEAIFADDATTEPIAEQPAAVADALPLDMLDDLPVDADDPWVEAFEEERLVGDDIPEWYRERLQQVGTAEDELPVAQPAQPAAAMDASLLHASLPDEVELSRGEPQTLPDWFSLDIQPEIEAAPQFIEADAEVIAQGDLDDMPDWLKEQVNLPETAAADDVPDWLKEAGLTEAAVEDVPDWLLETTPGQSEPEPAPVKPTPTPAPVPAPKPAASPAPVPVIAAADVNAALSEARGKVSAGDVDAGLQSYEAVVRANNQLDAVVKDLTAMLNDEKHKKNPAVYRVLGDGLMRQGQLQQALDTYRKALNLL